jgi:hypothetical protein
LVPEGVPEQKNPEALTSMNEIANGRGQSLNSSDLSKTSLEDLEQRTLDSELDE